MKTATSKKIDKKKSSVNSMLTRSYPRIINNTSTLNHDVSRDKRLKKEKKSQPKKIGGREKKVGKKNTGKALRDL